MYPTNLDIAGVLYPTNLDTAGVLYPTNLDTAGVLYPTNLDTAGVLYPTNLDTAGVLVRRDAVDVVPPAALLLKEGGQHPVTVAACDLLLPVAHADPYWLQKFKEMPAVNLN